MQHAAAAAAGMWAWRAGDIDRLLHGLPCCHPAANAGTAMYVVS